MAGRVFCALFRPVIRLVSEYMPVMPDTERIWAWLCVAIILERFRGMMSGGTFLGLVAEISTARQISKQA